jgi:hypothetical protein
MKVALAFPNNQHFSYHPTAGTCPVGSVLFFIGGTLMNSHTLYRLRYQAGLVAPGEYLFVRWLNEIQRVAIVRSVERRTEHVLNAAHLA